MARTISTKLELSISLEKLQSERTELAEELKQAEAYANELEVKIESLGNAKHKAQSWIGPLAEQLEMSIKKTLHLHQLEIERHFRAMIPSPHAFDQIEMQVRENRLELGIRYRNQSSDIGEPYLYLSNAQLNVLALSIFLSLGSKQTWSNVDSLLLDDPVQHLDDLDALFFFGYCSCCGVGSVWSETTNNSFNMRQKSVWLNEKEVLSSCVGWSYI